jgi:hypothetical protein
VANQLIEVMNRGVVRATSKFEALMELANLRISAGNAAVAEAELQKAAQCAESDHEWTLWVAGVNRLAFFADGGRVPRAGIDVFERLRKENQPPMTRVLLDISEVDFALYRQEFGDCAEIIDRAVATDSAKKQSAEILSVSYDLSVALWNVGDVNAANAYWAKAEALAESLPVPAAEITTLRFLSLIEAGEAMDLAWQAAKSMKLPALRRQFMMAYGKAAAGARAVDIDVLPRLQLMEPGASVYASVAGDLFNSGDVAASLAVLKEISPRLVVEDAGSVTAIAKLMQDIQAHQHEIAAKHAAQARAMATAFEAAAKEAALDNTADVTAEAIEQATTLKALANQLEK